MWLADRMVDNTTIVAHQVDHDKTSAGDEAPRQTRFSIVANQMNQAKTVSSDDSNRVKRTVKEQTTFKKYYQKDWKESTPATCAKLVESSQHSQIFPRTLSLLLFRTKHLLA